MNHNSFVHNTPFPFCYLPDFLYLHFKLLDYKMPRQGLLKCLFRLEFLEHPDSVDTHVSWNLEILDIFQGRQWHPTPVFLPRKIPWTEEPGRLQSMGSLESDTTEWLHFYFSLSCIGEGNGNPLQCSCLENPRDGGAWWAAVYGVAQSRTRLKRLSSSGSSSLHTSWWVANY